MDDFNSRLETIADLPDEELNALEQEMVAAFDNADASGDVDTMQQLADALDLLHGEQNRRMSEAPAADEEAAPPAEEQMVEEEPVAASGTTSTGKGEAVEVTSADVPESNQPVTASSGPLYTITAGGDVPGITAGQQLNDMDEVIDAITRKVNSMRGVSGDGERVIVASFRRELEEEFGDDRLLRRGDAEGNSVKIRKFTSMHKSMESLTAAGWCAPKTPMYDIPGIGSTATPVSDSMASFGVDRGGIIWQEPPSLSDFSTQLANLGVWKNTAVSPAPPVWQYVPGNNPTSVAGASAVKPCIDIPCGTERSAELYAVPLCLCFDNLMVRANPELVKATTDLIMVGQARFKEQYLLAQLFGAAGITNKEGAGVIGGPEPTMFMGATRDMLVQIRLVASQFRWKNRIDADTQMIIYLPTWLHDAMAADLSIQMPGDGTLSVSNAEIDGYLADLNVSPIWYIDNIPAGVGTDPTTAGSDHDSYLNYPTPVQWLLTLPGVFTRLDGGTLDLGVVRTKEDVQSNKYCEFAETFEQVVYMGPTGAGEAWAVRGTTAVSIRGGFAPAVPAVPDTGILP